jgi:hypothetical protein
MDSLGLVVHDEQAFLSKVVKRGTEDGILTRDRGDEILRLSVAMANKYVLQKEIDFRSEAELSKVQEAILKLVGIGLEIKSRGSIDDGVRLLMDISPVELFRLAHTRIDNLRLKWKQLLTNHSIQIVVSSDEYDCLSDMTCHLLSRMSIFTDRELYTIKSATLSDELFNSLGILEYYEAETERYEFILALKNILPFGLLNKTPSVSAENISEVDSIREAIINTLIVSEFNDSESPISVTIEQIQFFLGSLNWDSELDVFPDELEASVIEVIHELAHGLTERQATLLTKEVIRSAQRLVETIIREWDTVNSSDGMVFFKRWVRMLIVEDPQGHVDRILSSDRPLDEFEFESILERLIRLPRAEGEILAEKIPWSHLRSDQIVRLFHDARDYQQLFANQVDTDFLDTEELIDFIESLDANTLNILFPKIKHSVNRLEFRLEQLEILTALHQDKIEILLRYCGPPVDLDKNKILSEFKDAGLRIKKALFNSCVDSDIFQYLFEEAWAINPDFVKKEAKSIPGSEIGQLLFSASGKSMPEIMDSGSVGANLKFSSKQLNSFFNSLPITKKRAAVKFFRNLN